MFQKPSFLAIIAGVVFCLLNAFFIVQQRTQALVFQFGEIVAVHNTPGLKFKIPFLQNIVTYPGQILHVGPPVQQVILADQKRLDTDSYAYFRISDPLKFFQNLRTIEQARANLGDRINSNMREVLGRYSLSSVLSPDRAKIMDRIKTNMNEEIDALGVQLVDVRIRRADLPGATSEAIFARMRSEREREAREFRAQGQEEAQQIRAKSDKERTVLLATADKQAQQARGRGDADAIRIYASAFKQDPQFYTYYRTLEAYRNTMADKNTNLVLSPDNQFLKVFNGGALRQ